MHILIIIPTYDEAENISILLNKLFSVFMKNPDHSFSILVIDSNSPDGTAAIVKGFEKIHKNLHLILSKKHGLGYAYKKAFIYAKKNIVFDYVVMMDADLSHDPSSISLFLKETEKGKDFIIGSRYIKKGSLPDWSFKRKFISRTANMVARLLVDLKAISDCTSGYRCISYTILSKIDLDLIDTKGFAFQISLLKTAIDCGASISEIPIIFRDRKKGKSKMGFSDIFGFLSYSIKVFFKNLHF